MKEVEKLYGEYEQAKDRAEQYMFPFIALFDKTIQDEYNDLMKNFNEENKKLFVKNVKFMLSKIS
jgi:pyruvate/2-oxoacid:ferredoxin oxidoreductase alpha subunit